MSKRIYICHTPYHVLISVLKELNLSEEEHGNADIILSLMSSDLAQLKERLIESKVFQEVFLFDEKRDTYYADLMDLKKNRSNIILNMIARIKYTSKLARYTEQYVPADLRKYDDIYVYCDGDPIGTYLNKKRIRYHAVEDGLDTLRPLIQAKYDNRGAFKLKKFFSMNLNQIFMCDGYSKYCIDMEVNDLSCIDDDFYKYKEVKRAPLFDSLSAEQEKTVIKIFVKNIEDLMEKIESCKESSCVLILTEPLCTLDVRRQIFEDLIAEYSKEGTVILKPHPRDELDYVNNFPEITSFDGSVPMEIFRFMKDIKFKKVVSVYTQLANINFAEEKVYLGHDFMDKYEDPAVHRKNI